MAMSVDESENDDLPGDGAEASSFGVVEELSDAAAVSIADEQPDEEGINVPSPLKLAVEAIVRPVVESCGLKLYDLEVPHRPGSVLRIFIWRGPQRAGSASSNEASSNGSPERTGVVLDECAKVSKALEELPALDDAIPGAYIQEVSSPGVNRKLTKLEHFEGAIGETVKIVTHADEVVLGRVEAVEGAQVVVAPEPIEVKKGKRKRNVAGAQSESEAGMQSVRVEVGQIRRARVDFKF
jgi:ribosome maturation factor RimP